MQSTVRFSTTPRKTVVATAPFSTGTRELCCISIRLALSRPLFPSVIRKWRRNGGRLRRCMACRKRERDICGGFPVLIFDWISRAQLVCLYRLQIPVRQATVFAEGCELGYSKRRLSETVFLRVRQPHLHWQWRLVKYCMFVIHRQINKWYCNGNPCKTV